MGKIYFTSDWHFGHKKEFLWKPRGFQSSKENDQTIIDNYKAIVTDEDDIYVLGDLMLEDNDAGLEKIKQLPGKIHIILGNHDTETRIELYKTCPNVVSIDYAKEIKIGKNYFWLCHYPTITANYDDDKPWAKHLINLYAHTHQKEKFYLTDKGDYYQGIHAAYNPYMYCVCLDAHDNKPVELQEIINDIKEQKISLDHTSDIFKHL